MSQNDNSHLDFNCASSDAALEEFPFCSCSIIRSQYPPIVGCQSILVCTSFSVFDGRSNNKAPKNPSSGGGRTTVDDVLEKDSWQSSRELISMLAVWPPSTYLPATRLTVNIPSHLASRVPLTCYVSKVMQTNLTSLFTIDNHNDPNTIKKWQQWVRFAPLLDVANQSCPTWHVPNA